MSDNPYAAPQADVRDIPITQSYQPVRLWSADGRVGRLRYLAYTMGPAVVIAMLAGALAPAAPVIMPVLLLPAYIGLLVFSVLMGIKRSHDMNWSGWTVLLMFIPFVALIWMFKAGTEGVNRYGAPPPPNTTPIKILGIALPILVFLFGILAAIAIPAYQDYTRRAMGVE